MAAAGAASATAGAWDATAVGDTLVVTSPLLWADDAEETLVDITTYPQS
jgi:hypothetical protein